MKDSVFTITENVNIAKNVYRMTLAGDASAIKNPGEFINIRLDGFFLRRPISVCDKREDKLTLIYKVVGDGTHHRCTKFFCVSGCHARSCRHPLANHHHR